MKVASSAAHHFGSERLICESFGGIFMDATMQRMKWIADWEFVLGVNVLNPHGFHYTLEGPRKRDWPPSMFYQYPWWRYYERFAACVSRLSQTLTGGRYVAKVAVLWPINAMFAEYLPQERTPASDTIEGGLNVLTDALLRVHHDFDYLDEDVLASDAEIADGLLRIGDEAYELVVIPPMTALKVSTVEVLERFADAGGAVLGVLERPRRGLGAGAPVDIAGRVDALLARPRGRFMKGDPPAIIADALGGGRLLTDQLSEAIGQLITADVELDNDELFVLHRVRGDRDVYFVVNPTFEPQRGTMSVFGDVRPVLWDPSAGRELPVGPFESRDGRTLFDVALAPVGSTFVVAADPAEPRIVGTNVVLERVTDAVASGHGDAEEGWIDVRSDGHVARAAAHGSRVPDPIVLDGPFSFTTDDPNALVLRSFKTSPAGDDGDDDGSWSQPDAPDADWLQMRPGAWSYQLAGEPDRPYPVRVRYRVPFEVDAVPERLELVIDGFDGSRYDIFVNAETPTATPVRASFDSQMRSVDITPHVRPGRNILGILLTIEQATGGIVDNVKLMGPFALAGDPENGYRIAEPKTQVEAGRWTEQGYPFLSGTAVYRRTVELPATSDGLRLFLEAPVRDDVVEIHVNGEPAGVCLWDPYVVEITGHVRPGPNEIALSMTNTLANLLNGVARPAGLEGPPRIVGRASFEFDLRASAPERSSGPGDG
jgi:alpha-L-rhamnosidase